MAEPDDIPTMTPEELTAHADRRITKLAARELANYTGMTQPEFWIAISRIRSLHNKGMSDTDILRKLNP